MVLWSNYWNWLVDLLFNIFDGNPTIWGTYPHMYDNWFA